MFSLLLVDGPRFVKGGVFSPLLVEEGLDATKDADAQPYPDSAVKVVL